VEVGVWVVRRREGVEEGGAGGSGKVEVERARRERMESMRVRK